MKKQHITKMAIIMFITALVSSVYSLPSYEVVTWDIPGYPAVRYKTKAGNRAYRCTDGNEELCMTMKVIVISSFSIIPAGENVDAWFYDTSSGVGYTNLRLVEDYDTNSGEMPNLEATGETETFTDYDLWESVNQP